MFLIECLMAFKFFFKHEQTRANNIKQGVQTVKCLVAKQCLMVFGRQTFPFCLGPNKEYAMLDEIANTHILTVKPVF